MPCFANKQNRTHTARTCIIYLGQFGAMKSPNGRAAITITELMAHCKGDRIPGSWNKPRRECRDSSRRDEGPDQSHGPGQQTIPANTHGLPFLYAIAAHPRNQMESSLSIARAVHQVPSVA